MPRESIFSLHDEALVRQRRGERIIDGTVGVLLDDAGRLAVLPTVAAALDELPPVSWAPYAPVAGEVDFLNAVKEKAYPPDLRASVIAVATPGATGAVSLAIAMGLELGEALLTRSLHFTPCAAMSKRPLLPEKVNPSNIALTQHKIGARRAAAIGLDMACIGPVPALMMADSLFRTGQFSRIVVVASCQLQGAMDDTDAAVFAVCGDAAAAVALGPVDERAGVVATHLTAQGQYWSNVGIEPRGPRHPRYGGPCEIRPRFYIDHSRGGDVNEFFTWCMASVPDAVSELLRKASLTIDDVDWVCPDQNVKTVSDAWIDRIGIPRARVVETRKEYGNVGPANVLLNLDRGATNGAFQHADNILVRAWQHSAAATGQNQRDVTRDPERPVRESAQGTIGRERASALAFRRLAVLGRS